MISVEGVILPNQPLTNIQIIETVNKLKRPHFRGVHCRMNYLWKQTVMSVASWILMTLMETVLTDAVDLFKDVQNITSIASDFNHLQR